MAEAKDVVLILSVMSEQVNKEIVHKQVSRHNEHTFLNVPKQIISIMAFFILVTLTAYLALEY